MKTAIHIFLAFALTAVGTAHAQSHLPASEQGIFVTQDFKTGQKRARTRFLLTESKRQTYDLMRAGSGECDKFQQISWTQQATMREDNGFLKIFNTACQIKDQAGQDIVSYSKDFDHSKKRIVWQAFGKDGRVLKKKTFPIKGRTCDDVTLNYFLKPFVANRGQKGYRWYYLLTNEPKLYKCHIDVLGEETLKINGEEKQAIKFKLTGDMGIIDDILDKYVPQTYIWYEASPPHDWLKYQGLETSVSSANVVITLTDYSRQEN